MRFLIALIPVVGFSQSGSILCGSPPPAPPTCVYVCECDAYPYRCHFVLACPTWQPEEEEEGE